MGAETLKPIHPLMLTTLLATIDQAWAMEGRGNSVEQFSVATILGTSGTSITTSNAIQGYASARDDALVYVASAGGIHGAQLEQALRHYRDAHPQSTLSNMQIALAIASQG